MQDEQLLAFNRDVYGSSNAVTTLHAHFPQLVGQRPHVRQADALRSELFQQFGDSQKASPQLCR
jgi:hypothetical protein